MKLVICGSRYLDEAVVLKAILRSPFHSRDVSTVICGGASGADQHGKTWAEERGIPVVMMPADWEKYGVAAGPMRNRAMARVADACLAVWDGKSSGTRNMIGHARSRGLPLYVYRTDNPRLSVAERIKLGSSEDQAG